jgi:hypothetical protein
MPTDALAISPLLSVISSIAQTLIVVVGVVVSVLSFNSARRKEAMARELEAARPFLEQRQRLYMEAVKAAGVLANPTSHSSDEVEAARKRFRELYVAELSMVEAPDVEASMVALAKQIDPEVTRFTPAQAAAHRLSHALRDSFAADYRLRGN